MPIDTIKKVFLNRIAGFNLHFTFWPDGAVFKELQIKQNLLDFRRIWGAAR